MKKSRLFGYGIIVLFTICIASLFLFDLFPKPKSIVEELEVASRQLVPVINAIEKYKIDHGEYPNSLKKIVPTYINNLPKLSESFYFYPEGSGINYHLHDKDASQPYELSVCYIMGSLSSDVFLYYRKSPSSIPTSIQTWKKYKEKIPINKNWIYCF